MKYLVILLFIVCTNSQAKELNPVEAEYLISIDGKASLFKEGENRKVSVNGKNVEVSFSVGQFKVFRNYGISFSIPKDASAYLDESTEEFDLWNFDYHDSVMILVAYKAGVFDITDDLLFRQLNRIANNMNMKVSEPGELSIKSDKVKGKSAIGSLGIHDFLLEEFGFKSENNSFTVFYYSPLIERKSRNVEQIYSYFKTTVIDSLKY